MDIIRLWQDVIIDHDGYDDLDIKASDTYQQDLYERSSQCDSSHSEPLSIGESTCCHGSSHTFISLCQHDEDDDHGVDHNDNDDHDDDDILGLFLRQRIDTVPKRKQRSVDGGSFF